ncbi:hypothetical protein [Wolbachia endosymbiont of Chironomus riparius]|uniref:hypothetical protein n=1 Tax=Wolbachia endosymbiont of Chironomus riparius TaxID=2883238 RepID=UPI00209E6D7F|nr:hypothetical protein [Wolbachia endosymbiont of Chironomus riparius]
MVLTADIILQVLCVHYIPNPRKKILCSTNESVTKEENDNKVEISAEVHKNQYTPICRDNRAPLKSANKSGLEKTSFIN